MARRIVLSLCMIVRDEEENIAHCLNSVRGAVDEIVVVDTGSKDRTPQVAREMGAGVFHFHWADDFSAARNHSISRAKGDYIFWLDADDRIRPSQLAKLSQLRENLARLRPKEAFYFVVRNVSASSGETFLQLRLFPRIKGARFEGRIHEQIYHVLQGLGVKLSQLDIEIDHLGYHDEETIRKKARRNLKILLEEHGEDPSNPHIIFHLANTYAILGDSQKAISHYERMLKLPGLEERFPGSASRVMLAMASEYAKLDDRRKYKEIILKCYEAYPDDSVLKFFLAELYMNEGRLEDARGLLEELVSEDLRAGVFPLPLERIRGLIHKYLARCLEAYGLWPQVSFHMSRALERLPDDVEILGTLGRSCLMEGREADALSMFTRGLKVNPDNADLWCNAGVALRRMGHEDKAVEAFRKALEIWPEMTEARANLGQIFLKNMRIREAGEEFQRIPWEEDGTADIGLALAMVRWMEGDIDGFVSVLDRVLRILDMPRDMELRSLGDLHELLQGIKTNIKIKGDRYGEIFCDMLLEKVFQGETTRV